MTSGQSQPEVLDLLMAHEDALHELYSVYASQADQLSDFWSRLAAEESQHAASIRALSRKVEQGQVTFTPGRFSAPALRSSLEHAQGQVARAKQGPVPLGEALSTALDLENGLIERKFYEVFEGDDPGLANVLRRLAADTEDHRARVQAAWKEHR